MSLRKDAATVDASGQALAPSIPGVQVHRLTTHSDHRGALTAFIDDSEFWAKPIVYAYRFSILPGRIKGWGMHEYQTDRYFIVTGNVRVVLYDGEAFEQFYFTQPGLISIPPGIWHADQNWGETEAHICNFPTVPYDPDNPDKFRIAPDSGEVPFDWTLRDG